MKGRPMRMLRVAALGLGMVAGSAAARAAGPCDGHADATAALNALLARGGQIRLPAGICLVSGSVFVVSDSTVTGAGIGVTVIKSAVPDPSFPVVSIGRGSAAHGAHRVDISALSVDGSARRIGQGDPNGLEVGFGSSGVSVHGVEVHDAGGNGIAVETSDVDVQDSVARHNYANGLYVIGKPMLGGTPVRTRRVRLLRNRVSHNSLGGLPPASRRWDGIDVDPITVDCLVQDNIVIGNDIILFENARRVASSGDLRVIGNVIQDSVESGINVIGAIDGFQLIGNRIERTSGFGIVVNGPVRHGLIRDNVIRGATRDGIVFFNATSLPGAPEGIVLSGNTIAIGPGAAGRAAVMIAHRASDIRITGNALGAGSGVAAVDARAAGTGIVVEDNR